MGVAMSNYEQSYLGQLRQLIGKQKIFAITARAIVRDDEGWVLLVQRTDNRQWVMPAGSMELEESILETCQREVYEESGLIVESATLIAVYSNPRYSFVTTYGDPYQMISFVFWVDRWAGDLQTKTDETLDAQFFPLNDLPSNINPLYLETLEDLAQFDGTVIVK